MLSRDARKNLVACENARKSEETWERLNVGELPELSSQYSPIWVVDFLRRYFAFKQKIYPCIAKGHVYISSFYSPDLPAMDDERRNDPETEREIVRLWRCWRTVHELCHDRVHAPYDFLAASRP